MSQTRSIQLALAFGIIVVAMIAMLIYNGWWGIFGILTGFLGVLVAFAVVRWLKRLDRFRH